MRSFEHPHHGHPEMVMVSVSKNSKAVKKLHPCKVEVTDYAYQKSKGTGTCSTANKQNQHSSEDSTALSA